MSSRPADIRSTYAATRGGRYAFSYRAWRFS
jgi:hypothetical protein